jgi:glycosyltransferase involved in cell wall biosynthesis
MEKDLITVAVPVYNASKYLDECIESIVGQTYKNLEIILVNDGSLDNSLEICNKWKSIDERIQIIDKENQGVGEARNTAIDNANGEYIAFIDADDIVDKHYIEYLVEIALRCNAEISYCRHIDFDNDKQLINNKINPVEEMKLDINSGIDALSKFYPLWIRVEIWGKLIKLSLFENIRFPNAQRAEDLAVIYKLIYKANVIAGAKYEKMYYYRQSSGSAVRTISSKSTVDFQYRLEMYKFLYKLGLDDTYNKLSRYTMRVYFDMLNAQKNNISDYTEFKKKMNYYGKGLAKEMFFMNSNGIIKTFEKNILKISPSIWKYYKIVERKIQLKMGKETLY